MGTLSKKLTALLLLLFYIFSPRLDLGINLHTGYASVAALIVLFFSTRQFKYLIPKELLLITVFVSLLIIYYIFLTIIYDHKSEYFVSIGISIIASIIFGWMFTSHFFYECTNAEVVLDQLLLTCVFIGTINSITILFAYFIPELKNTLEAVFVQAPDGNISYADHPFRLRGIASAGGASLSIFNAMIILIIICLVKNSKISNTNGILISLILTCSNIFTGRTGLIASILFTSALLYTVLINTLKVGAFGVLRALIVVTLFSATLVVINTIDIDPEALGWAFEWIDIFETGRLETASSEDLASMFFIPDNYVHLLFGIGFFEGSSKLYPRTDSGYLKTILSIGLPLAFLLYLTIVFMLARIISFSTKYRFMVSIIIVFMLTVELKEPFLYQNYSARVIFLVIGASIFLRTKLHPASNFSTTDPLPVNTPMAPRY